MTLCMNVILLEVIPSSCFLIYWQQ